MKYLQRYFFLFIFLFEFLFLFFITNAAFATAPPPISMALQTVPLADALHALADSMQQDIIVSPDVTGNISLTLQKRAPAAVFDTLLQSQHLIRTEKGHTWIIQTQKALLQHVEQTKKLRDSQENLAPLHVDYWHLRYASAADVGKLLQEKTSQLLSNRGSLSIDARSNRLVARDTPDRLHALSIMIQKMDIPIQQVMITAKLVSIDSDFERTLGIDFSNATDSSDEREQTPAHYALAVAHLANSHLLDIQLAAAEQRGHAELLSSPRLFTANYATAFIESGEEIPYQEISRSGATGVAFKKAVLRLKVTPQILPQQRLLLKLEINQDKPASRIVLGVPAITTRQLASSVQLKSGQTIVLGGIFETNQREEITRIPLLSELPLLGKLFQQQALTQNKRELLIFVTPWIMN